MRSGDRRRAPIAMIQRPCADRSERKRRQPGLRTENLEAPRLVTRFKFAWGAVGLSGSLETRRVRSQPRRGVANAGEGLCAVRGACSSPVASAVAKQRRRKQMGGWGASCTVLGYWGPSATAPISHVLGADNAPARPASRVFWAGVRRRARWTSGDVRGGRPVRLTCKFSRTQFAASWRTPRALGGSADRAAATAAPDAYSRFLGFSLGGEGS